MSLQTLDNHPIARVRSSGPCGAQLGKLCLPAEFAMCLTGNGRAACQVELLAAVSGNSATWKFSPFAGKKKDCQPLFCTNGRADCNYHQVADLKEPSSGRCKVLFVSTILALLHACLLQSNPQSKTFTPQNNDAPECFANVTQFLWRM